MCTTSSHKLFINRQRMTTCFMMHLDEYSSGIVTGRRGFVLHEVPGLVKSSTFKLLLGRCLLGSYCSRFLDRMPVRDSLTR